ncbi:MAG: hydroxymethylbilane synthase [Vicinamibacterales bacterium]
MRPLRIGTRGSALALWQARTVAAALERAGTAVELVTITTRGDARQDAPLAAIGGKGVFVTEIHDAMRRGDIDVAVHSAKDMAAVSSDGLMIAAVLPREDPRDAFVFPVGSPEGLRYTSPMEEMAVIGTGSPRRIAQLRQSYPAARFEPIRGNVDTRLRKLDAGEVDALVLACAGLRRLGLADRISQPLPVDGCVPAPGQGIIAIEVREDDARAREVVAALNDAPSRAALAAEQAVVAALGGGCQLPLGAFATVTDGRIDLRAVAASLDGTRTVHAHATSAEADAAGTGARVAQDLASRGAMELLHS